MRGDDMTMYSQTIGRPGTGPVQKKHDETPASFCYTMGWGVGTKVRGSKDGVKDAYFQITAIGDRMVIGKRIPPDPLYEPGKISESSLSFDTRTWHLFTEEEADKAREKQIKLDNLRTELNLAHTQATNLVEHTKHIKREVEALQREVR